MLTKQKTDKKSAQENLKKLNQNFQGTPPPLFYSIINPF